MIKKFQGAVRANRQLASTLQTQGMNEAATNFAYNAQVLRRQTLLEQIMVHQTQIDLAIGIVLVLLSTILFFVFLSYLIDRAQCQNLYEGSGGCRNGVSLDVILPPPLNFIVFFLLGFMLLASIPIIYTRFISHEFQQHIPLWKIWLSLLPLLGGLISLFISLFVYLPSIVSAVVSYLLQQLKYVPYFLKPLAFVLFLFLTLTFMLTFIPFKNRKLQKIILSVFLLFDLMPFLVSWLSPLTISSLYSTFLETLSDPFVSAYIQMLLLLLFIAVVIMVPLHRITVRRFRILLLLFAGCVLLWLFILNFELYYLVDPFANPSQYQLGLLHLGLLPPLILLLLTLLIDLVLSLVFQAIKQINFFRLHLYETGVPVFVGNQVKTQWATFKNIFWERPMAQFREIYISPFKGYGQYSLLLFLDALAGFGYKPGRSLILYLVVICGFAVSYSTFGHLPLLPDAFVYSLTSFHGRGFFPGFGDQNSLHNPLVVLAAIEAVVGLVIEISFMATFTQRFFGMLYPNLMHDAVSKMALI